MGLWDLKFDYPRKAVRSIYRHNPAIILWHGATSSYGEKGVCTIPGSSTVSSLAPPLSSWALPFPSFQSSAGSPRDPRLRRLHRPSGPHSSSQALARVLRTLSQELPKLPLCPGNQKKGKLSQNKSPLITKGAGVEASEKIGLGQKEIP